MVTRQFGLKCQVGSKYCFCFSAGLIHPKQLNDCCPSQGRCLLTDNKLSDNNVSNVLWFLFLLGVV